MVSAGWAVSSNSAFRSSSQSLGRPRVTLQLCGPSIEFGLAMIEFLLPAAEVLGKLRRLGLDLPRDRLGVRRRRGWLFAAPRLQIDAAVQAGRSAATASSSRAVSLAARVRRIDAGFSNQFRDRGGFAAANLIEGRIRHGQVRLG